MVVKISDSAKVLSDLFDNFKQAEYEIAVAMQEMEAARMKLSMAIDKRNLINAMARNLMNG